MLPLVGEMEESKKLIRRLEKRGIQSNNPLMEAKKKLGKIYRQLRRESSEHYLRIQRQIRSETKVSVKYPICKVKFKKEREPRQFGILGD